MEVNVNEELFRRDAKFTLGQVVATSGVKNLLERETLVPRYTIRFMLNRHVTGDWGEVGKEDWQTNDNAVEFGSRILSSYTVSGERVWIITDASRSTTTMLLPEEY